MPSRKQQTKSPQVRSTGSTVECPTENRSSANGWEGQAGGGNQGASLLEQSVAKGFSQAEISQLTRAEGSARKREGFIGSVLDNLFAFVGAVTPDGTLIEANRAPLVAAGIQAQDVLGKKFWDCYWWNYSREVQEQLKNAIERACRNEVVRYDVPVQAAGGRLIWIDFQIAPLRDETGRITHLIPSAVDITERKLAEQRLRESELFYRQTLESIPGMVFTTRPDGYCDYQSQQWVDYTGVPSKEHLGEGWNKLLHPDDRPMAHKAWRAAVEERAPYDLEYRVRRRDGEYEWFKVIGRPIRDTQGHIVRWFGVALNIQAIKKADGALRESEERLRLAKAAGQIGIHDFNPVTGELVWDERLRELWGMGANDPVNYEAFIAGVHPDDRAATDAALKQALDPAGNGQAYLEFRLRPSGQTRWIAATGQATFRDRRAVRFIGTVQDITREKEFLAELERLVEERTAKLHELVGELEHFSYSITHDMRAPLRAMRGFAEVVNERCADSSGSELKTFLKQIITSAERMDLLITGALDYSTAVRKDLKLVAVDAGRLLEGMLETYPQFLAKRQHIRVDGTLPSVLANEAGLTQCFSNLIGNALKFVEAGKDPEVRIRAELGDDSGSGGLEKRLVRIWVEDKGIGIPPTFLPRMFQMFARGSRTYEGTGIGLALVRKVVERMGGRVGVESEVGKGSRFWVELSAGE